MQVTLAASDGCYLLHRRMVIRGLAYEAVRIAFVEVSRKYRLLKLHESFKGTKV